MSNSDGAFRSLAAQVTESASSLLERLELQCKTKSNEGSLRGGTGAPGQGKRVRAKRVPDGAQK